MTRTKGKQFYNVYCFSNRFLNFAPLLTSIVTDSVLWLFLEVSWVCLQCEIMVFPDHTHLLFCKMCALFVILEKVSVSDLQKIIQPEDAGTEEGRCYGHNIVQNYTWPGCHTYTFIL